MCGIVGMKGYGNIVGDLYDALIMLQHRGQDAAGICTYSEGRFHSRRSKGWVREVFSARHVERLRGSLGIGHVRYPTAGDYGRMDIQPVYASYPYGITLAHNGNLVNGASLAQSLVKEDLRHANTDMDSELLLNVLASELTRLGRQRGGFAVEDLFSAVRSLHARCLGGYAVVAVIAGHGLLAFRDPFGIRPLVYGKNEGPRGAEWLVASETVALDILAFEYVGDLAPGEALWVGNDGQVKRRLCAENARLSPCIFEHVYLARPDSILDNISVYKARLRMGEKLAAKILRELGTNHDIDAVIPVPDTSRTAALPLAHQLQVKYREGFIKNRYVGRTFIMPCQRDRKQALRRKLNLIDLEFRNKNVLLVDDSIVRGTTAEAIVAMVRRAGARKVYFASASPPVRYSNVYGIDTPTTAELIAHGRDVEQVREAIGVDRLFYQDLEDLISCAQEGNRCIESFECSVFDGHYIAGGELIASPGYFEKLTRARGDAAKAAMFAGLAPGSAGAQESAAPAPAAIQVNSGAAAF